MADTLSLVQGTARDFVRQVVSAAGVPFAPVTNPSPFLSSDALTATVWPGGNLSPVVTPAVSWIDAIGVATYMASFAGTDTAALPLGTYRYQAFVTRASKTAKIDDARFRVTQTPGTGAAALAFTTRSDLVLYAPWIEDLQADSDEVGFDGEQLRATNRLITILCRLWRPNAGGGLTLGQPGFQTMGFGSDYEQSSYWLRQMLTPLAPSSTPPANMPDRITQGTPPNYIDPTLSTALLLFPEVKEICAKWAIGYICDGQIGGNDAERFSRLGGFFQGDADRLFFTYTFQVDLSNPQTGYGGIPINGGASRLGGW